MSSVPVSPLRNEAPEAPKFCSNCGSKLDLGSTNCGSCGAPLTSPVQPTGGQAGSMAAPTLVVKKIPGTKVEPLIGGSPLAGMGDRAIAVLLDTVLIGAFFALTGMWAATRWGGVTANGFDLHGAAAGISIFIVVTVGFAYFWLFESAFSATLGKAMLGLLVRRTDGSRISVMKSLIRNALRIIDGIAIYVVGLLIAIFSRLKQRLGDHLAGTVVLRVETSKLLRALAALGWLAIIVACLVVSFRLHSAAVAATGVSAVPIASAALSPAAAAPVMAAPVASGEPRVTRAELGSDKTDDYKIINPSTEFYTDTPKIVCVWEVASAGLTTPIKSVWLAEDVGSVAPPNYKIAERSITGVNVGSFSLTQPNTGWPIGRYRLDIYIGDTLAKQVPFSIKPR